MLKRLRIYNLSDWIAYLMIRYQVYVGEYQRSLTKEFSTQDLKAYHYVFIKEKHIIGIVKVRYEDNVAEVGRVTIAKKYRGKSYGKEMMSCIIKEIKNSNKAQSIRLFVQNNDLVKFYQSFGFVENEKRYFNNMFHSLLMIKIMK